MATSVQSSTSKPAAAASPAAAIGPPVRAVVLIDAATAPMVPYAFPPPIARPPSPTHCQERRRRRLSVAA